MNENNIKNIKQQQQMKRKHQPENNYYYTLHQNTIKNEGSDILSSKLSICLTN